jgi:Zn-dependent peptidase ImmA (M78 family)
VFRDALVRKVAADAVAQSGQEGPPVDLNLIASRAGVAVRRSVPLPPGMKACYDEQRAEIRVRNGLVHIEERFAVAHELGHHFLEHGGQECMAAGFAQGVIELDDPSGDVDVEAEAQAFAGQVLIPREWCRRDMEAGLREPEIAERYDAPRSTAFITVQRYRFRLKRRGRR